MPRAASTVRTVETHWIPLRDGRRLAARLFLPLDAETRPVPLILEYIPYRRRDGTRIGDDTMHLWFAANGFASARVDIAGMGDSDGILEDEYVKREQDDGIEILDHFCAQPWCSGTAGMIGISWGGFSGLQLAARRPAQLRAIVTVCSTDDRYGCDAHYNGGCLINDQFGWGGSLLNYAALPPDPAVVGPERWRDLWRQRLGAHMLYPATWLHHQRRDAFWQHGSVAEDYGAIDCAVLAVGGWLDGYTPTIFRLVENLTAPAKGLAGPWGHKYPNDGVPSPAIGFLQECKRWFDRWLSGAANGADSDPAMRLWLMDPATPSSHMKERPGRWLGFPKWPAPQIATQRWHLADTGLASTPAATRPAIRIVSSPLTTGLRAQEWCPYGQGNIAAEGAMDQREDDAGSLCFDTAPLTDALPIMGTARLTLRIAADRPQAMVAARLTSVAPDGASAFLTFALLNLAHRSSHEHPEPLVPGRFETVELIFKPVGEIVPVGHRLRIALSSSYWPMAWPSPTAVTLSVDPAGCHLDLPLLASEAGLAKVTFEPPVHATPGPVTTLEEPSETRTLTTDIATEQTSLTAMSDHGRYVIEEIGTEIRSWRRKTYSITRGDPTSCSTSVSAHTAYARDDWRVSIDTDVTVTCDAANFHLTGWVRAYEGDKLFAEKDFRETIPRDCM